ncbi:hypothetical protein [Mariniflexile maritimum]|uniref:hypothetical protein n=1 Tax=Mariniflexile maritimum TaxID=2682493 RepID=UPI0018DB5400|nr:hypothetical protein [Mariniflexile maritimum]
MQNKILWIGLVLMFVNGLQVNAQYIEQDSTYKKWFVGSTLSLLGNFDQTNNPEYIQLNVDYRITPKDLVSIRFKGQFMLGH